MISPGPSHHRDQPDTLGVQLAEAGPLPERPHHRLDPGHHRAGDDVDSPIKKERREGSARSEQHHHRAGGAEPKKGLEGPVQ